MIMICAFVQESYQIAKWNGTKVSVKILDKDYYTDPESMYVLNFEFHHPSTHPWWKKEKCFVQKFSFDNGEGEHSLFPLISRPAWN